MRYTERYFDKKKFIDSNVIAEAVDNATNRPSSCNLQLTKFINVDCAADVEYIKNNCTKKVNWCNSLIIVLVDSRLTWERNANYISAGIIVEGLLEELARKGVSACPIAGFYNDTAIRNLYNIPVYYQLPLLIFVGHSSTESPKYIKPYRTELKNILSRNEYYSQFEFSRSRWLSSWQALALEEYRARIQTLYADRDVHSPLNKLYYENIINNIHVSNAKSIVILGSMPFSVLKDFYNKFPELNLFAVFPKHLIQYAKSTLDEARIVCVSIEEIHALDKNSAVFLTDTYNTEMFYESIIDLCKKHFSEVYSARILSFSVFGVYYLANTLLNKDCYHNHIFYKSGAFALRRHNFVAIKSIKFSSGYTENILERLRLGGYSALKFLNRDAKLERLK